MKNIIGAIVVAVCILAGSFGGSMLKGGGGDAEAETHAKEEKHADDGHGKKDKDSHGSDKKKDKKKKKDKHGDKKKDKHGGGHGDSGSYGSKGDVSYFSFSREFVVPLMRDNRVDSLVILNLNLEVNNDYADKLFSLEPKLRDNIMTTLISLSNDGTTLDSPTNTESYETIRSVVLHNLQSVVSTGIENVLILDMAKQDV